MRPKRQKATAAPSASAAKHARAPATGSRTTWRPPRTSRSTRSYRSDQGPPDRSRSAIDDGRLGFANPRKPQGGKLRLRLRIDVDQPLELLIREPKVLAGNDRLDRGTRRSDGVAHAGWTSRRPA